MTRGLLDHEEGRKWKESIVAPVWTLSRYLF